RVSTVTTFTCFFMSITRPSPRSTLFPYTTLFRSDHNGRNYWYAGGGNVSANFPFRRCDEWDGITLACCSTPALGDYRLLKMRFSDRKSTRLNSSHVSISYAVFCLKKKTEN